ncbi:MAG: DUF3108 domain-containing protein [Betaproteobacteria bacterium]|nr:DUF3108 domain-containing protein [Betaproteobacteria bacterium]
MAKFDRRHLIWALLASMLLHMSLLGVPEWLGWRVPALDELLQPEPPQLDAYLLAPIARKPVAPAVPPAPPATRAHRTIPRQHSAPLPQLVVPDSAAPQSVAAAPPPVPEASPALADAPQAGPVEATPAQPAPPTTPTPPLELALPRRGSIRFVVSRGDQGFVVGQSVQRWRHDEKTYSLSNVTETTGIAAIFRPAQVKQISEGEVAADGLRPRAFHTEKNGVVGDAAVFDWSGMRLTLAPGGGSQRVVPLVIGAQDMLSMFYQFSAAFPRSPQALNEIMVATGRKFERYAFEVLGEERLTLRQGAMRTLHLRTAAGVEAIDIWMGLDLYGLPLKIRYTDREGESFVQLADKIEFAGMPDTAGSQ